MGKSYTDFSQLSKGMFKKSAPVEEIKPLPKTNAVGGEDALSFFGLNAPETPTGASAGGAGDGRILALEADVRAVRAESAALEAAKAEAGRKAGDLERQLAAERQMREAAEAERERLRGVSVSLSYNGSYVTNATYVLPSGSRFSTKLTREAGRRNLVTRRDCFFGGKSVYWHSTEYDLLNRPTNATDSVSHVREWLYNRRSELAAATIEADHYDYAYDSIGNRLWSAANAVTNSYTANSLNQYMETTHPYTSLQTRVGMDGGVTDTVHHATRFAYDADGNMTGDGTFAYAYDAENRLVSATSAMETNGAIRVLNAYDPRNRRIRKIVQRLHSTLAPPSPVGIHEWETQETHTFVWDGSNIVLEKVEFADGTARTFEYFWGADKSGTLQGAGGVGGLLYLTVDGSIYVPCCDGNGNVTRYLDANGTTVAQYTYDAFGRTISQAGPLAHVFRHRFSTKYFDAETGLYYYGYRFYSPVLRRWLTRDPIEEGGGLNLYGFCGNNAMCKYDKDGRAYFAYRPLDNAVTLRMGIMAGSSDFMRKRNWVIAHEQLIFEDGGTPVDVGYFNAPIGDNNPRQDEFHFQTQYVPIEGKGAYNDCVMHEAVKNVRPRPYKLWTMAGRSTGQYNCQDYADDLRAEYYRLSLDLKIRCKCNLK